MHASESSLFYLQVNRKMLRIKSINILLQLQNLVRLPASTRRIATQAFLAYEHNSDEGTTNSCLSLEKKIEQMLHQQQQSLDGKNNVSIYRVPNKLRKVEEGAYAPHFISIGPYHHESLKDSQWLKQLSLNHLLGSGEASKLKSHQLIGMLRGIEEEARGHYSDSILPSDDDFVEMMLLDGCFIVQLFRDLNKNNFAGSSLLSKRWMLPVVRRDLITLENQMPMLVIKKLFEETKKSSSEPPLEELALRFFDPLMPRAPKILKQSIEFVTEGCHQYHFNHLLDLFHSSISLREAKRNKEPHMYWSVTELKETGIKVRVLEDCQPLEMRFEKGVLRIPCLQIDDHTGSFLRNIVAYEQCQQDCKPDMTSYLFFLDKLINSADDVGLLHYEGVIQHTLGSNKQVAKLVNKLCTEVEHDGWDSYLFEMIESINTYTGNSLIKTKARLKHDYFSNVWVSISTIAALLLLYLTLLQTSCDAVEAREKKYIEKGGWWGTLNLLLVNPIEGFNQFYSSASSFVVECIFNTPIEDLPPFFFSL